MDDGDLDKVYLASCIYQSYIAANRCVTSSLCTLETAVFDKGKKAKYVASKGRDEEEVMLVPLLTAGCTRSNRS